MRAGLPRRRRRPRRRSGSAERLEQRDLRRGGRGPPPRRRAPRVPLRDVWDAARADGGAARMRDLRGRAAVRAGRTASGGRRSTSSATSTTHELRDDAGCSGHRHRAVVRDRPARAARPERRPATSSGTASRCLDDALVRAVGRAAGSPRSRSRIRTTTRRWSSGAHAFGAPVYLHADDREWVQRPDPAIDFWERRHARARRRASR